MQVEQHEVGLAALDEGEQLRAGVGLADDVDAVAALERPADAVQHQRVIVCDQNLK